jgi:uncharacterized protein DUF5916/cellulose/xylan binding protein with CBM9 domain
MQFLARHTFGVVVGLGMAAGASGQTPDRPAPRIIRAVRTATPPTIDGRLTEEAWAQAPPADGFTQRDPDEGRPATERTEVRVLFDDTAVYIGARMFDGEPGQIQRRLSSRDGDADADRLTVFLDPMRDKLTGAIFRVSAANVQQDAALYNDSWWDTTWDAVWQSQVATDDQGWTAELRIPLSQLRFTNADRQTWGINVERFVRRKNEASWLEMVPKTENGNASRMLELNGLDGMHPRRNLELLPYVAARAEYIQPSTAGNPFNDGSRGFGAVGLDMKWGLTSNLTVSATVNPDFGQVEVDPAVVNLTAFETFFNEKRPFFLEGSQIFNNFGRGGANDYWGFNNSEPQIFYSRRIGRAPQVAASGDYVDAPTATTILGAAKLTGKTSGRWSVGLLQAITGEETARTSSAGLGGRAVVEPLTSYTVARVQRDIGSRTGVGLLTTSVSRQLETQTAKDGLSDQAMVVGADAYWFLDRDKEWVITGDIAGSRVAGTTTFIEKLQRAPQRYYQRPDEPHVHLDLTRTSLSGFTGRVNLNRNRGVWRVNAALWTGSPGWESNDLGFHGTGDRAGAHAVWFIQGNKPRRLTRSRAFWVAKSWTWNYGRELQSDNVNAQASNTFMNYWSAGINLGTGRRVLDDRLTRGGPSATSPSGGFWNAYLNTDSRRWLSFSGNYNRNRSESGGWNRNAALTVSLKPSPRLTVSTGPNWQRRRAIAQYVTTVTDATATDTYGGRYVFGELAQRQLTMTTRVSVIVTPKVSMQVFAQPLLAVGDYSDFKELARPRTYDFLHYGTTAGSIAYDGAARTYAVDPDAGGAAPGFTFNDPDFNFKSLRVNAVFRWEVKPGSAFYAVWTRQQTDLSNPGVFAPGRDARALFGARGDDVFLVKMAYWLGR